MPTPRTSIVIDNLKDLTAIQLESTLSLPANASLNSDIGPKLYAIQAERVAKATAGKLALALTGQVGARIDLLNSASDQKEDATGVFGKSSSNKDYGIEPSPRLHANATHAWLKYAFTAGLRAEAGAKLGIAAFSIEASRSIEYAAFRRHAIGDRIATGILGDLASMPTALSAEDVADLKPGEAVSMRVPGAISVSLDLDESVFASSSLIPIADSFGLPGPVTLVLKRGVNFGVDLAFQDDTRLVFVGLDDGWTHASLRKATSSKLGIEGGINFSLGLSQATQEMLVGFLDEALFDAPEQALDALSQAVDVLQLSDEQQSLLAALGIKLGVVGAGAQLLQGVQSKLADRKEKLLSAVKEVLKTKLEIGFKFEYSRIATDGSLFEAELSPTAVLQLHASLLAFDLRPAMALARAGNDDLRELFFLHERSVERTSTLGFTLGFGKWLQISTRSIGTTRVVVQTNEADEQRLAWISSREIAGAFNASKSSTKISFRADTLEFRRAPTTADVKLSISMDSVQTQLKPKHLIEVLDLAALWRVFSPTLLTEQDAAAQSFIGDQKNFDATLALVVSDRLVRTMAEWIVENDNAACAPLLARALPYWAGHEARKIESLREQVYAPIFATYLEGEQDRPNLDSWLKGRLIGQYPSLARDEASLKSARHCFLGYATRNQVTGGTIVDTSERHPIGMRLRALRNACRAISTISNSSVREMDQVLHLFYEQQKVFSQRSFTVRFFGALLAQVAVDSGHSQGWSASLTLSYKPQDGERQSLIIGKGRD